MLFMRPCEACEAAVYAGTMIKRKSLFKIAFFAIALASCSFGGRGSETVSLAWESVSLSSAPAESGESVASSSFSSSRHKSSRSSTPESPHSSLPSSSSNSAASSSSPNKVYQTVSVYQCYYIPDQDKYGNPRFDFRVKGEKGEPLFSGDNLSGTLGRKTRPVYTPIGGSYAEIGFFVDEACTVFATNETIVESDMNIYYYCRG